jgi:hypothetical protein
MRREFMRIIFLREFTMDALKQFQMEGKAVFSNSNGRLFSFILRTAN